MAAGLFKIGMCLLLTAFMGVNVVNYIMTITISLGAHLMKLRKACNVLTTMQRVDQEWDALACIQCAIEL